MKYCAKSRQVLRFVTLNEAKMRLLEAEKKSNVVQSLGEKGYSTETNKLTQKQFWRLQKQPWLEQNTRYQN